MLLPAGTEFRVEDIDRDTNTVRVTVADKGPNFSGIDTDSIVDIMEEQDMSYPGAVGQLI